MENTNCIWKPIAGFEGFYEISSDGRVRSLDRIVKTDKRTAQRLRGRELRPAIASTGYKCVVLCGNGKPGRTHNIHSLLAEAFIGPRPQGAVVDHIDGNRANNALTNLRYTTQGDNARNVTKASSKSGALGVYKNGTGWQAQIVWRGARHYLGTFRTIPEAISARDAFKKNRLPDVDIRCRA